MEECCELCEKRATIDCDSDQAKLCWDCDRKVHSANFLVAKHTRVLLCRLCNSPTPWKASGPDLTPTVSLCHCCLANRRTGLQNDDRRDYVDDDGEYSSDSDSDHTYDDDDEDYDGDDDDDEDDDGENQVVPMSSPSSLDAAAAALAGKGLPDNSLPIHSNTQDETGSSSSETLSAAALPGSEESTSMSVFRPLKERGINQRNH